MMNAILVRKNGAPVTPGDELFGKKGTLTVVAMTLPGHNAPGLVIVQDEIGSRVPLLATDLNLRWVQVKTPEEQIREAVSPS